MPVQINGKLRSKITVPADADATRLEAAARADARIAELLAGKQVVKVDRRAGPAGEFCGEVG